MIDDPGIIRHARNLADEMRHDPEVRATLLALAAQNDRLLTRLGIAEASAAEWRARYEDLARLAGARDALRVVAQAAAAWADARAEWEAATARAVQNGIDPLGKPWTPELEAALTAESDAIAAEMLRIDGNEDDAEAALRAAVAAARAAGAL